MKDSQKMFTVSWNELHRIQVKAASSKEAQEKIQEMTIQKMRLDPTYEVQIGKAMAVVLAGWETA